MAGGGGASGARRSWGTAPSGERGEERVLRLALRLGEVHLGWEAGATAKARRRAAHGVGVSGREASRARGTLAQRQGGLVFNETGGAKAGLAEGSARG